MRIKVFLFWLVTVIIVFVFTAPLAWIFLTSIKSRPDILHVGIDKLFLFSPTLSNYQHLFQWTLFVRELGNTAIVAIASTVLVMAVSVPAAYSFSRYNTGGGHLLFVTISTRMFPGIVAAIPFFFAFSKLGLMDTHLGLTLLIFYFNMSFATFLLFGFFRDVPEELEQAAAIDGYGRLDVLRRVVFPLIMPGVAVTAVFCLVWSWNEFLYSVLFTKIVARTVSVGLALFWGSIEIQWGPMCAGASIAILPTLLAAWFMQRYIIRGLTFGAVKG
jgi:multiple sugar transport system permease protein